MSTVRALFSQKRGVEYIRIVLRLAERILWSEELNALVEMHR